MPNHTTPTDLLDPIEKASRDEVTALQTQRLKATLANVYQNVPHYRQAFDAAGVHPSDFKVLADLAKFPFTNKKDLRAPHPGSSPSSRGSYAATAYRRRGVPRPDTG